MGGGFSFGAKLSDGTVRRVTGKIVGKSGDQDVDVEVKDSPVVPDGVYSVPSSKGEAVRAVLPDEALSERQKDPQLRVWSGEAVDLASLKRVDIDAYKKEKTAQREKESFRYNKDLMDVAVDIDSYASLIDRQIDELYEKYVPADMRNAPIEQVLQTIADGMGVEFGVEQFLTIESRVRKLDPAEIMSLYASDYAERVKKTLDGEDGRFYDTTAVDAMRDGPAMLESLSGHLQKALDEGNEQKIAHFRRMIDRRQRGIELVDTALKADPGTPEHRLLMDKFGYGLLDILAATEQALARAPELRGSVVIAALTEDESEETSFLAHATVDGSRLKFIHTYKPSTVLSDHNMLLSASYRPEAHGTLQNYTVHVVGSDGLYETAVHESAHLEHFYAVLSRFGVKPGNVGGTLYEQIAPHGEIKNTVVGALIGMAKGASASITVDDLASGIDLAWDAVQTLTEAVPDAEDANSLRDIAGQLFGAYRRLGSDLGALVITAVGARADDLTFDKLYDYVDDRVSTPEAAREFVEGIVEMPIDQFIRELVSSISEDLGQNLASVSLNGVTKEELFEAVNGVSIYARTNIMEAFAEGTTFTSILDTVENADLEGNEEKLERLRKIIERIRAISPAGGVKLTSEKTRSLLDRYSRLAEAVKNLDRGYY